MRSVTRSKDRERRNKRAPARVHRSLWPYSLWLRDTRRIADFRSLRGSERRFSRKAPDFGELDLSVAVDSPSRPKRRLDGEAWSLRGSLFDNLQTNAEILRAWGILRVLERMAL